MARAANIFEVKVRVGGWVEREGGECSGEVGLEGSESREETVREREDWKELGGGGWVARTKRWKRTVFEEEEA